MDRFCSWCRAHLNDVRRGAKFCSQRCRQASWRFGVRAVVASGSSTPMRFAYADPPYPGKASYYPEQTEVDHADLVSRLSCYDGWALSTSPEALSDILRLCPQGVRVCAWFTRSLPPRHLDFRKSWEPLIVYGGRRCEIRATVSDSLIYKGRYNAFPGALIGMKPPQFAEWVFRLLGAQSGDSFIDLYPGSGAVSLAWRRYASLEASDDAFFTSRGRVACVNH